MEKTEKREALRAGRRLGTGCKSIDRILGGGVESGVITTLCGAAGTGKTHFVLQLIASALRDGESRAVLVETEMSFPFERFEAICGSRQAMERLHIIRPTSFSEFCAALQNMTPPEKTRIIAVDSIISLYRLELADRTAHETNRKLARSIFALARTADTLGIPVVVTDHIYSDRESSRVNMVGGDLLEYASKCIVRLEKNGKKRRAVLLKHRSLPEGGVAQFEITESGIVSRQGLLKR